MNKNFAENSIPPEAKKVFRGIIFDVYQWEQKMYDGSTTTFEKLKRPDSAYTIPVLPDGKILIADQEQPDKQPFTGFLGGAGEKNEEPIQTAKRELMEESGYESDEWSLFSTVHPVPKMDWTIYGFVARNCRKVRDPEISSGEKITLRTVSFEELQNLILNNTIYDPGLKIKFLEAKLDPHKMAELKKAIFG